jgi:hypothetical protein
MTEKLKGWNNETTQNQLFAFQTLPPGDIRHFMKLSALQSFSLSDFHHHG